MADIWETKNINPMLIGAEEEPFDSKEYIFELKLDGERCIAYLDKDKTILKNKRNILMLPKVPELSEIHKNVNVRCILDGELAVIKDGKPDFFEIQKRSLMSNPIKIEMASKKYPACFTQTAFSFPFGISANGQSVLFNALILRKGSPPTPNVT